MESENAHKSDNDKNISLGMVFKLFMIKHVGKVQ